VRVEDLENDLAVERFLDPEEHRGHAAAADPLVQLEGAEVLLVDGHVALVVVRPVRAAPGRPARVHAHQQPSEGGEREQQEQEAGDEQDGGGRFEPARERRSAEDVASGSPFPSDSARARIIVMLSGPPRFLASVIRASTRLVELVVGHRRAQLLVRDQAVQAVGAQDEHVPFRSDCETCSVSTSTSSLIPMLRVTTLRRGSVRACSTVSWRSRTSWPIREWSWVSWRMRPERTR